MKFQGTQQYIATEDLQIAVNAAITLQRPLLIKGEPGTGKSTLLEFLWKLSGRADYEGIELSKASHAGRWRSLEQLANLPLVLMEGDRDESSGRQRNTFDLNEAKGLYNGKWYDLQALGTEGQNTSANTSNYYRLNQIAIPVGFGYKKNINKKWSIKHQHYR